MKPCPECKQQTRKEEAWPICLDCWAAIDNDIERRLCTRAQNPNITRWNAWSALLSRGPERHFILLNPALPLLLLEDPSLAQYLPKQSQTPQRPNL